MHRFNGNLRRIRRFLTGRCGHRPLQHAVQYRNRPSIPEMSRTEIDAVCPQMRVVHLPEPKAIRMVTVLRPSGRSGRGAAKNSRASARNMMRLQAPLFAHFFWQDRKSGSAKQQLRSHRKSGTAGANRKCRADRVVGPYKLPCRIARGATVAVLPHSAALR